MADRTPRKPREAAPVEVQQPEEPVQEQANEEENNKAIDLAAFVRQEVTAAVQPLFERIGELEQQVNDLQAVVTQPSGSVQFFEAHAQPAEEPGDNVPWYSAPGG